eukprot:TRINITY_DN3245_c0_g1_i13.p1 TRINITY_DN3245_c0_g1~~TRINITY_DN3245_c0_g1_i13.p1  ORF type:complete len:377 (-),score=32.59 TRINITY_DN3245_c0_g1_i13:207-1337(-)
MSDPEEIRGTALLLLRQMSGHEVRDCVDGFLQLINRSSDWLTEIAQTIFEEALSSNLASVMCADLVYTLARSLERDHVEIQFTKAFLNSIQDELDPQGDKETCADAQLKVKADRRCASAQFLGRLFNRGLLGNRVITLAFRALAGKRGSTPPENCIMGVCDLLHVVGRVCKVQPGSSLASHFDTALERLDALSRATDADGSSVYSLQALDRMKEIMDFQMVGWPSEPKLVVQVQQIIHNDAAHVRATLLSGKTCMLLSGSLGDLKRLEDIVALHMGVHPCRLSVTQCCGNRNDVEGFASLPLTDSSVVRFLPVMDHKGKIILDLLEDTMYTTKTAVYYRRSASYCDKDLNIPALQAGVIVSGSLQTDNWIKVSVAT